MRTGTNAKRFTAALSFSACCLSALAASPAADVPAGPAGLQAIPVPFQVRGELPPLPGVTDLKFRDFFKLPIGPRGLEATALLRSLDGRAVRMVGYMVRQEAALTVPGMMILAPLPVALGDEDESFADDLPASAVYVHLAPAGQTQRLPFMPGLMVLTGTLQVGAQAEADGRRSMVRLLLDDAASRAFDADSSLTSTSSGASFSVFKEKLNDSVR